MKSGIFSFYKSLYRNFLPSHLFSTCLYLTLRVTFVAAECVRYRSGSGGGKYIGFGLRIKTGTERTTNIVDTSST